MEKTALIITDGADSTQKLAKAIAGAISTLKTIIMPAETFDVTKLLAAEACFFGAENPDPPSFFKSNSDTNSNLCEVLAHISLAGRPCGVFSVSKEAIDYLCGLVCDSEAALCPDAFLGEGDVKAWIKKVFDGAKP